jgi:hypothetical protein
LLASLLRATVLQWARIAVAKFQGISSFTGLSAATWFVVVRNVTTEAVQLLLSEQTALWVLYIIAPRTFDVSFKLKVEMHDHINTKHTYTQQMTPQSDDDNRNHDFA